MSRWISCIDGGRYVVEFEWYFGMYSYIRMKIWYSCANHPLVPQNIYSVLRILKSREAINAYKFCQEQPFKVVPLRKIKKVFMLTSGSTFSNFIQRNLILKLKLDYKFELPLHLSYKPNHSSNNCLLHNFNNTQLQKDI